jgi:hypothetical protein
LAGFADFGSQIPLESPAPSITMDGRYFISAGTSAMAKKKVDLDEDDFDEEVRDEEAVDEEDEDFEPEEEEEPKPRGSNTTLTLVLCALNVVAALAFAYLLVLDFQKRQEWSYAVFLNELYVEGLPLEEEDSGPTVSRYTLPRQRLNSEQIKAIANLRGVKGSGEFWAVDEHMPNRIQPKLLTPEVLKDYFSGQGAEVPTLEDEVRRLKKKVPEDIHQVTLDAEAAFKGKDDASKRRFVGKVLLPLAYDVHQVDALDKKLKAAKGLELDVLVKDAVERRLLVDFLAPFEIYRPGDFNKLFLERVADLDKTKLVELRDSMQKRFDVAIAEKFDGTVHLSDEWTGTERHSWEKRQAIGFLLVDIANLQKPDFAAPDKSLPLYPDAGGPPGTANMLRAQTVLGLYEFAAAAQNLPLAWNRLEEQVIRSIHVDRQGFDLVYKDKDGKEGPERSRAFVDKHDMEIRRIQDLLIEIRKAEERLKSLQEEHKTVKKIFEDRDEHLKAMTKKLLAARAETARQVGELRKLQEQLYRAQAELRDAAERNARLEQDIRAEERKAKGLKGDKTP